MKKSIYKKLVFGTLAALLLPLSNSHLCAQTINLEELKGLKIRNIGPAAMSGRITAIDVDPLSGAIYAGAASGGVWKSTSGGITWTPIFEKAETQSIGAIAINPKNPSEIWVGTGEGNPRNSQNFGEGIYKSLDGGKNWVRMGLEKTKTIHRICINPQQPEIIYVAAQGSAWGPNPERGVYRTTDGGKTWKNILFFNNETGVADMVMDPSNPNKIIVAMWEYGRKPWKFISGGKGSGIHITHDGGETWAKVSDKDGLPSGDLGRCGLAICRTKPNVVYALVEAKENAIYRSDDGGAKWRKVGENGDRPFYYAEIYVDPINENRLYNLYSRVSRSEDGGKTWTVILPYEWVHPDHHAWWINPNNPLHMIDGNDGGLNITYDGGKTWQFCQNIPVGQFYHVNVDNEIPYNLYGGLQDNGSWVGPSAVWKAGGIRNADWQEVMFGDGFDAMPQRNNTRYGYAMSQGGFLGRFDRKTGKTDMIQPQTATAKLRFNWNAAMAQDPFEDNAIYYGSQFLHKSSDFGRSWQTLSPDLTTNDTFKINESQRTGGLTPDVTNAENHCTILAIAPSPVDKNVVWVGTDDGNVQVTSDGGKNWTNFAGRLPECPKFAWIPQIEVSAKNAGEAFVVVNHYRFNDDRPFVYHTRDMGKTWTRLVDEKKVSGYVWSVAQDPIEPNLIFVGTDKGLFISFNYGKNFQQWTNDYPSVPTSDLKIHPRDADLIVATFGRSLWILDDIRPLREIAKTNGSVLEKELRLFDAPDAYTLLGFRSTDGERFQASAIYEGANRIPFSLLTVWIKKSNEKSTKKEKAKVSILNESGDTIRTFSPRLENENGGINRFSWDLRQRGVRGISWEEPKADADEPVGRGVLPGRYKLIFNYKNQKDSTYVNVKPDPRHEAAIWEEIKEKYKASDDFAKVQKVAGLGFERLREALKIVDLAETQFGNAPDTVKKEITKLSKAIKDSIQRLQKLYTLPRDEKGINRNPDALDGVLGGASMMLNFNHFQPSPNTLIRVEDARKKANNVFEQVNRFFENDWKKYQEKVESAKYSIFKKYEALKVE